MSPLELLPPEILDLFIEQLSDSNLDLKSCCLVSKSWLFRARKHLFRHVILAWTVLEAQHASMLVDVIDDHRATFQNFFRTPEINACVRGISIELRDRNTSIETEFSLSSVESGVGVSHRSLPISSTQDLPFRNLSFLELDWFVFLVPEPVSFGSFADLLMVLPQLEHLMLKAVDLDNGEDEFSNGSQVDDLFACLATHCSSLKTLCIEHLVIPAILPHQAGRPRLEVCRRIVDDWERQRSNHRTALLPLRRLYLDGIDSFILQNIVLAVGCFQTVSLERVSITAMQFSLLAPYDLRNVTHLTLGETVFPGDYSFSQISLPSLEWIQLRVRSLEGLLRLLKLAHKIIALRGVPEVAGLSGARKFDREQTMMLHIQGPDDLCTAADESIAVATDIEFLRLGTGQNPYLSLITINQGREILRSRFPKSIASAILESGQGDIWWDVNYW